MLYYCTQISGWHACVCVCDILMAPSWCQCEEQPTKKFRIHKQNESNKAFVKWSRRKCLHQIVSLVHNRHMNHQTSLLPARKRKWAEKYCIHINFMFTHSCRFRGLISFKNLTHVSFMQSVTTQNSDTKDQTYLVFLGFFRLWIASGAGKIEKKTYSNGGNNIINPKTASWVMQQQ